MKAFISGQFVTSWIWCVCMHGYCTVLAVCVVDVLCLQNLFTFKCMLWHMSGDGSLGVTLLFLTGSF